MSEGIDTASKLTQAQAQCVKDNGKTFICRYYSVEGSWKLLIIGSFRV